MPNNSKARLIALGSVAAFFASSTALAQIETVVVTAQKRSQDVQVVPITVDAFSGDDLRQSNINTVNDLQTIAPSLFVYTTTSGASDTTFKIRGVGTTGNNPGLEGAVGTFVDGVYRNRSGLALGDLIDIERIEVLEGPQSTLFGKNTSAGALNIITRSPDDTYSGMLEGSGSNYGGYKFDGWVNVPISDTFFTRWGGVYDYRDGFVKEVNSGKRINNRDRYYLKGQALWEPNNDLSLRVIADYSHGNERCCAAIRVINGPTAPIINTLETLNGKALTVANTRNFRESLDGPLDPVNYQDMGISAELNWQANSEVKLTNITAYRSYMQGGGGDTDFTGAAILTIPNAGFKDRVFSEELRFSGHHDVKSWIESVDWLAGLYYTNEEIRVNSGLVNQAQTGNYWCAVFLGGAPSCFTGSASAGTLPIVPLPPPPVSLGTLNFNLFLPGTGDVSNFAQHGDSWSAFGQATLNVTSKFSVTGGIRYSKDTKSMTSHITNTSPYQVGAVPGAITAGGNYVFPFWAGKVWDFPTGRSTSSTAVTGTVNAQYFWTEQVMTYVSYSHGYKSGGFNLDRTAGGLIAFNLTPTDPSYRPETTNNYEAGIKSKWFDNSLLVNATLFYEKIDDLQVLNFDGISFHIFNEPKGTSKGFEANAQLAPLPGLMLDASVTYADTEYGAGALLPLNSATTGAPTAPAILTGKRFTNAPLWSTTEGITYSFPLWDSGLTASMHGDMLYSSTRDTGSDLDPKKRQGGYTLFNARATLIGEESRWELAVWCRNCGDKRYVTVVFNSVGQSGSYDAFIGDPRVFGVTGAIRF